ncbi:putative defense protein, partial [Cherax quadricarinatus]|uniref:putative defense protein n=1 Tax=Cherax quadricarinatus TaxID=27406 RepID=UPI00387EE299
IVAVLLQGLSPADTFKGFFVKAFDSKGSTIGSFVKAPKTIDCDGKASGAHHANPSLKESVTVTWAPPQGYTGTVTFVATVVQTQKVFWINIKSNNVVIN